MKASKDGGNSWPRVSLGQIHRKPASKSATTIELPLSLWESAMKPDQTREAWNKGKLVGQILLFGDPPEPSLGRLVRNRMPPNDLQVNLGHCGHWDELSSASAMSPLADGGGIWAAEQQFPLSANLHSRAVADALPIRLNISRRADTRRNCSVARPRSAARDIPPCIFNKGWWAAVSHRVWLGRAPKILLPASHP